MAKQKIKIDEKTRMLLIGIGVILFTFFVTYVLIYKSYYRGRNSRLIARIKEEKQNRVLRKKITGLYGLKDKYHKYLYETEDTNALRKSLSSLAAEAGVDIVSMQPHRPERIGRYSKVSFNIRLRCSYDRLGKFIESIETYPTLTSIEELNLQAGVSTKASREDTIAEVSLLINAYCMPN